MSEKPQWLKEHLAKLHAEQDGKPREDIATELEQKSEHVFDPLTAPAQNHNWIDRGMKLSCEGAGHPYHQSWKRKNAGVVVPM